MNESTIATEPILRFGFGDNWSRFLSVLNQQRIGMAEQSLKDMLTVEDLKDKTFLDVGCGSGLFSLVARQLGARVYSFDCDPESVACAQELKRLYCPLDSEWTIAVGSVLDKEYLRSLGSFDVVYSWGVLHHTGAMWQAMENVRALVKWGGKLAIAIYNDQGWKSCYWRLVKRSYNKNGILSFVLICVHIPCLIGGRWVVRILTHRRSIERGMSLWFDMIDWLGGYPFEVAKPEEVHVFYRNKGFGLCKLKTCGDRHGCNEFVFVKKDSQSP
ncbi:MAG: class I SAM-dependent methyltransferase [Chloroflexi bacterium]|nr:MAG: class I SAM-dependent methyltransferase [Chloroflexota bacterium]